MSVLSSCRLLKPVYTFVCFSDVCNTTILFSQKQTEDVPDIFDAGDNWEES